MVLCKKVFTTRHVTRLSHNVLYSKVKSDVYKQIAKHSMLSMYIAYDNILKTILTKLIHYTTSNKSIIFLLIALL